MGQSDGLKWLLSWLVAEPAEVEFDPVAVDDHDDAGAIGSGGHQVVIQSGQQHVVAVLRPGHHALADAELAGDFDLGHLRCLADHREVHRIDPVHLLGVGVGVSDVGGELRVGQQPVQALVSADETRLAGCGGLMVAHGFSS